MKDEDRSTIGCVMAVMTLVVQFPLFAALFYGLLSACNPDAWVWVVFWVYVPIGFVFGCCRAIVEAITK